MTCCTEFYALLVAVAIVGVSFHYFSQWMKGGQCHSQASLTGKTVIITGANAGIGKETARDLARRGARVIMACRSMERATKAAKEIQSDSSGEIVVRQLDLTSFKSIRKFAEDINESEKRVDILINNAGLMCVKSTTEDGFDTQFCTNHLGHFLLTHLLLDKLKSSVPARIVNVSSRAHRRGKMYWDDLNMEKPGSYDGMKMYDRTKLANILFTRELAQRLKGIGVNVYALHPGVVTTEFITGFTAAAPPVYVFIFNFVIKFMPFLLKNCEQGAQTSIYCAVAEELDQQTGLYYSDCAVEKPTPAAEDDEAAKKLWTMSMKMVGIKQD